MHTAICVQYRVGATAAQAGSDKETPISKNTKFSIEAQSFDRIQISKDSEHLSILINLRYRDITISKIWPLILMFLRYGTASISKFQASISKILRYRVESTSEFQSSISKIVRYGTGSISNITTLDIDVSSSQILGIRYGMSNPSILSCHIVPDIEGHFPTFDIEGCTFDIIIYGY